MIPGEMLPNEDRETTAVTFVNLDDRPVQVGSHCHFLETNKSLKYDRETSYVMRLDIPAGTSVRFEPGDKREVGLVAIGGRRIVRGLNGRHRMVSWPAHPARSPPPAPLPRDSAWSIS